MRMSRGRLLALAIALATVAAVAPAAGAAGADVPHIVVRDGVTQPVFGYADAIRERVFVTSDVDSDHNGVPDVIAADVMRPRATDQGLRVPVIMVASPYYSTIGRGNEHELKQDVNGDGLLDKWPLFYDNYFVPRGYAVVLVDMVGTNNSNGCPVSGGTADNLSAVTIIDWLNGRRAGRDAAGHPMLATWHDGRTGMIGKSYDGTLANAAAALETKGLTTIVPISAISSWYDYSRSNGIIFSTDYSAELSHDVTNPDRRDYCEPTRDEMSANDADETGNYNSFWAERDYTPDVGNVRASVFVVHGINDDNVKPDQFANWWAGLTANHVPRKLWLSQTGHVDPFDFRRGYWVDTVHRWFDYWLQRIDNGIMDEPMVDYERSPGVWETHRTWPLPGAGTSNLWLKPRATPGAGTLGVAAAPGKPQVQSFQDDPTQTQAQMIGDPGTPSPYRLAFLSAPLSGPLHISGIPTVRLTASADQSDTNFGALLVDYGTERRIDTSIDEGITTLTTQDCWGESSATDDACYYQTAERVITADQTLVTKGIVDARHLYSLTQATPLVPGQPYAFTLRLLPEDYIFTTGHRIGVIVVGSYPDYPSMADQNRARISVSVKDSRIVLPVVGGRPASLTPQS